MSGLGGDLQIDLRVQQVRQAVDRVEVGRIGHGHRQIVVVLEDRHDAVFPGDVPRDRPR